MNIHIIEQIEVLLRSGSATRLGIARSAGIDPELLQDIGSPGFRPDEETMGRLRQFLVRRSQTGFLASVEEIIDEARNGRMFILVDDETRENEGDLIIPAQMATPNAINFMATHGRGLICLAITRERSEELRLEPMSMVNGSQHETAFTVSIEAREGVTTGISAADRSRTISVAINAANSPDDLVTPGHVFPLVARDGGVLVRAGHTEAAVDVSRLAGLNPSGVICEIMNDDGSMSRLDDIVPFARRHGLKIGTIRDLIAYRRKHDHLVEKRGEIAFESRWGGEWKAMAFYNRATKSDQMVLQKGEIDPDRPTTVRMHQVLPIADMFGGYPPRCQILERSMELIAREGSGVIVAINRRTLDYFTRLLQEASSATPQSMDELRDYGVGAQILSYLGVHDMILLTDNARSLVAIEGYGLNVIEQRSLGL